MFSYFVFIIFCVQVIFAKVLMWMCQSNLDCLEGYSCHEEVCKKCLRCGILFRKGNLCVTDFMDCGDCLTGYEEVLITDYSIAIKPCKPLKKIKSKKCTSDSNCPQNNYCSEESCVKCFDCSLINRLAPKENCARSLNECGSCLNGFYEVAVTTNSNSKPCENSVIVIPEMSDSYEIAFSNIAPVCFLFIIFIGALFAVVYKRFKDNSLSKTSYQPPVCPSAPPLYTMDAPPNIEKLEETELDVTTLVKDGKQQAKVFKQPDASYYHTEEGANEFSDSGNDTVSRYSSWIPTASDQMVERNCPAGALIHRYLYRLFNNGLMETEIDFRINVSLIMDSNAPEIADDTTHDTADAMVQVDNPSPMKCRKCRHLLFFHPEVTLFNGHGESYSNPSVKYISCGTIQEDNIWFLQDNCLPQWISDVVNNNNWTKGKVNCPNCQGRLGSFDFVSGTQCQCGSHILPPVHIVKCKVDCRNQK